MLLDFSLLTMLMSDWLLRGSSQARSAEETRMQTRMKFDMIGWPCSQWQKILSKILYIQYLLIQIISYYIILYILSYHYYYMTGWPCSQWQKILGRTILERLMSEGVVRKSLPETVVLGEYEEGSTGWDRLNLGAVWKIRKLSKGLENTLKD